MSTQAQAFQQACRARLLISGATRGSSKLKLIRPVGLRSTPPKVKIVNEASRFYATKTDPSPSRRAITVTSDDGRYNWTELSTGEKAARTTQQSFNFLLVAAGITGTCLVIYYLYTDLFASDSYTVQFNHAVDRIRSSSECRELLGGGSSSKIKAYGDPTSNKWARARPLAHSLETDRFGTTHFRMRFNVEGADGTPGVVTVHMARRDGEQTLQYRSLLLRVNGKGEIELENQQLDPKVKAGKMFGIQWR